MASPPAFFYAVTAQLPDEAVRDEFEGWLIDGHIRDVIEGGALWGRCVRLDSGDGVLRVEAQYGFASREAFDAYQNGPAIDLRREGIERFAEPHGVTFSRRTGTVPPGGDLLA